MESIILKDMQNTNINLSQYLLSQIKSSQVNKDICYSFPQDKYIFKPDECIHKPFYTSDESCRCAKQKEFKPIALLLNNIHNVTIDGNNSEIIASGKQIYIMMNNCSDIKIKNLTFDYVRPTITEFEIICTNGNTIDVRFNKDSWYHIMNGDIRFFGNDGTLYSATSGFATYAYQPQENSTTMIKSTIDADRNNFFAGVTEAKQLSEKIVRLSFLKAPKVTCGNIYQVTNTDLDGCGIYLNNCSDITFADVNIHFSHGYTVLCNLCQNLNFISCNFVPRNNRHVVSYDDFFHLVGCNGNINIYDCQFDGCHNSAVKAHGIYQKLTSIVGKNQISVKYSHPHCYNFDYYAVGDIINIVDRKSLVPLEENQIVDIHSIGTNESLLTLKYNISHRTRLKFADSVVDNINKNNASIFFYNNKLSNICGNGIEISTLGKNTIKNNIFFKIQKNAVCLPNDAIKTLESCRTKNMLLEKNNFIECAEPVINICPNVKKHVHCVNYNIVIDNNNFKLSNRCVGKFVSTKRIVFSNNFISEQSNKNFVVKHCSEFNQSNTKYSDIIPK